MTDIPGTREMAEETQGQVSPLRVVDPTMTADPRAAVELLAGIRARRAARDASGEMYVEGSIYEGMEACLVRNGRTVAHVVKYVDAVEIADRLATQPADPVPSGWFDMESAPKDGDRILATAWVGDRWARWLVWWDAEFSSEWSDAADDVIYEGAWTDGTVADWGSQERYFHRPTHWRPYPTMLAAAPTPASPPGADAPIPMILHCPVCHVQHVDEPEDGFHEGEDAQSGAWSPGWDNPPHRSHLCHGCGCIWRPADVPTEGVREVATHGKADNWTPGADAGEVERLRADFARLHDAARGCEFDLVPADGPIAKLTLFVHEHGDAILAALAPREQAGARDPGGEAVKRGLIWSGEHHAYWRPDSAGYTIDDLGAGVYSRAEFDVIAAGAGPKKKLEFRPIDPAWPLLAALQPAAPPVLGASTQGARDE